MKLMIAALLLCLSGVLFARDTYVKPYVRKDGTHVQGHYRTAPDNTVHNNYSTKGNINPYTGKEGTVEPDKQPLRQQKSMPHQGPYQPTKRCYEDIDGKKPCY